MEIFLFIILMAFIFGVAWLARQTSPANNKPAEPSPKKANNRSNRSDPEAYLFQAQVARSQHNKTAENYFLMGAMDTASDPVDEHDEEDDQGDYNDYAEEEYYDDYNEDN